MHSRKKIIKNTRAEKHQEKKRILMRRLMVCVVLLVVLVGGLAWASGYEKLIITSVRVDGAILVHADEVKVKAEEYLNGTYGYLFSKRNIFLYPDNNIKSGVLGAFTLIDSVRVSRESGNILVVTITERKPSSVWCPEKQEAIVIPQPKTISVDVVDQNIDTQGVTPEIPKMVSTSEQCYFVNRDGLIYTQAPFISGLIFFTWYAPLIDPSKAPEGNRFLSLEEMTKTMKIVEEIKKEGIKIASCSIEMDTMNMTLGNGSHVLYKREQGPEEIVANVIAVQHALPEGVSVEYLDLRFGTKVFYKEKEENRVMTVSE